MMMSEKNECEAAVNGKQGSKYTPLWLFIKDCGQEKLKLSYGEIEKIVGVSIDHSFLNYKKELTEFGYKVGRISMKEKTVMFERVSDGEA